MPTDPRVVGARIARKRQARGWTQVQLADRLGVAASTVANWERGAAYPKRKLGLVEEILGPVDPVPEEPQETELDRALGREEADVIRESYRLKWPDDWTQRIARLERELSARGEGGAGSPGRTARPGGL